MASSLETNAVSLERINQYITGLDQEEDEPLVQTEDDEEELQLEQGTIQFENYSVR